MVEAFAKSRATKRDQWVAVLTAIKFCQMTCGFEYARCMDIADSFSKKCKSKYDGRTGVVKPYDSVKPNGSLGVGSLWQWLHEDDEDAHTELHEVYSKHSKKQYKKAQAYEATVGMNDLASITDCGANSESDFEPDEEIRAKKKELEELVQKKKLKKQAKEEAMSVTSGHTKLSSFDPKDEFCWPEMRLVLYIQEGPCDEVVLQTKKHRW